MINDIPTFRADHMPYGGVKESGIGREGPRYAIEEMSEMKLICWRGVISMPLRNGSDADIVRCAAYVDTTRVAHREVPFAQLFDMLVAVSGLDPARITTILGA